MVCVVLDPNEVAEGRDYDCEPARNVLRFHHGLPPDVVEYVMVREEIRFTGSARGSNPRPWPRARFRYSSGAWRPVQNTPVRFSDSESFSTLDEFVTLCVSRILSELSRVTPLEVFSVLYSLIEPSDCLKHTDILGLMDHLAPRRRRVGKWQLFFSS